MLSKFCELIKRIENIFWRLKKPKEIVPINELLEFYKHYESTHNLLLDMINDQVMKYGNQFDIEKNLLVDNFIRYNKYNYNRLIVDTLLVINTNESFDYLVKILKNSTESKINFRTDFGGYLRCNCEIAAKLESACSL